MEECPKTFYLPLPILSFNKVMKDHLSVAGNLVGVWTVMCFLCQIVWFSCSTLPLQGSLGHPWWLLFFSLFARALALPVNQWPHSEIGAARYSPPTKLFCLCATSHSVHVSAPCHPHLRKLQHIIFPRAFLSVYITGILQDVCFIPVKWVILCPGALLFVFHRPIASLSSVPLTCSCLYITTAI